jgi:hypothetical protein
VLLPRKQRNDVAFELRALLTEELQAKAEAVGGSVDAAMATEFLRAFGRPADVAARYRPTLTIIDPADGHAFVRASVIGLVIIWSVGLMTQFRRPAGSSSDFLTALGHWWGATLIPSMWWPGVLVVGFGLGAWIRRKSPQVSNWRPRAGDRIPGGRTAMVMALLGVACGLTVLVDPRWVLELLFGGRIAPAAFQALTYTESFHHRQAPALLALLALNIPLYVAVIVSGRWSALVARIDTTLRLLTCAMLVWIILDGPVFLASSSDQMMKFFMVAIVAVTLVDLGIKLHRSVKPSPNQQTQAQR